MFCDKESVSFPTHYFLIIQNLLADGLTALYSHKARFFNQSEYALYLNYNINGYIEHCFTSQVDCLLLWIGIIEKRWVLFLDFLLKKHVDTTVDTVDKSRSIKAKQRKTKKQNV